MSKKISKPDLIIFKEKGNSIEFRADISNETFWATQLQIARAFEVDIRTINEHIQSVLKSKELDEKSTIRNFRIVQKEGTREVDRDIKHYNLDMILSVGYRVNSKRATLFRQWATKILRAYIVDGFAINRKRIGANYAQFMSVVESIKKLLPTASTIDTGDVMELISLFADTWLSLDAYDKGASPKGKQTKKKVVLTAEKINSGLVHLKSDLLKKAEATDIFGVERFEGSITGIVGNVMQSFGGKDLYPTIEEKAAHLLYFIVKNHPFIDGNKRSGAFSFIWFLKQAEILDVTKMTPQALTALTILVASSDPEDKDKTVSLILNLITRS